MPIKNGIDVLPQVLAHDKETAVIIVTGVAETKIAFDTLKLGAYDYIMKPFDIDEVMVSVEKALEKRNLIIQNREYQENLEGCFKNGASQLVEIGVSIGDYCALDLEGYNQPRGTGCFEIEIKKIGANLSIVLLNLCSIRNWHYHRSPGITTSVRLMCS